MDKFLESAILKLSEDVSVIKTQVAVSHVLHEKNSENLKHHIKRTDELQKQVELLQRYIAWWGTTAKVLAVAVPIVALILKLTGVISDG